MYYYNYKPDENDYNECISKGVCSTSPTITALQEVMFVMLTELAFYIRKLELLGAKNEKIKLETAQNITYLASLQEYSQEQVLKIINALFSNLINARNAYTKITGEQNATRERYKSLIKIENNTTLNKLISDGDKAFKNKYEYFDKNIQNYAEILFGVIKSLALLVIDLSDNRIIHQKALDEIIKALNIYNSKKLDEKKIRQVIYDISDLNAELMLQLNEIKIKKFGVIRETEVSHSTEKGKAILVSGSNLTELQKILEVTHDKDIDVYTNGNLLIAHAYSKFCEYKNLKGHFGNGVEPAVLDFATFPGAIVLTKNEAHNIEYLYRGKIFTTDKIPPQGVARLDYDNLIPLIESARETKGFTKGQKRLPATIGFDINEVDRKFREIAGKLNDNTYKYLFIIGLSNYTNSQDEYFKNFFRNMPDDAFVISFSYSSTRENVYTINVANDYTLVTELLFKLFDTIPIESDKITFFLTRCDAGAFAGMVRLNKHGAKNVYMSNCLPTVMNPTIVKAFKNFYNINNMTTATADLEKITTKTH